MILTELSFKSRTMVMQMNNYVEGLGEILMAVDEKIDLKKLFQNIPVFTS